MTRNILFLFLLAAMPGFSAAEETRILAMSGTVEIRVSREGQWVPASLNAQVPEGGAIRTGADGAAVALMPNKTKVWLKESSSLELEQRQTLATRLALVFGRIKVRVPHLMRKEKFEVRTPAAVCAVRGTEFTVDTDEAGAMNVNVAYGEVKLSFVVPPDRGPANLFIPQGRSMSLQEKGKPGRIGMMTPDQERFSLENWHPGLSPEERRKELQQKEADRAMVREFARVTNGTESTVRGFLSEVRESDMEAGRTLKDVHGNTVRVSQFMMRPSANEIQFVNLVKRPTYNASNISGIPYNGGQVENRLDYMQVLVNFNKPLPQRIDEWPGFFSASSVKTEWVSMVAANRTNADEIFFVSTFAKDNPNGDGLINDTGIVGINPAGPDGSDNEVIFTGVLKNGAGSAMTATQGLNYISRGRVVAANPGVDGTLKFTAQNPDYNGNNVNDIGGTANSNVVWAAATDAPTLKDPGDPEMYNYTAKQYQIGNAGSLIWLTNESYAINNAGSVRSVDDITGSSMDTLTLLKDMAGETIISVKRDSGIPPVAVSPLVAPSPGSWKGPVSDDDYFAYNSGGPGQGTNIDLVFIPDLMVAAVQRMLPAITKMND